MNEQKIMKVLLEPKVTEKSSMVGELNNQYVFKVTNVKGKRKIFKRLSGQRANWKKAYIRLKPGFDIDFMGNG